MKYLLLIASVAMLSACANPFNRITSGRYVEECRSAETAGDLLAAEILCYRALVNVDRENVGHVSMSKRLYKLGRIKRQLAKYFEAEGLMKESLELEEKLSGVSDEETGLRLAELSVILAAQDKWGEGIPLVERLVLLADSYSGRERSFVSEILQQYSSHARLLGKTDLATEFESKARALAQ